jgi:hypothetical protein
MRGILTGGRAERYVSDAAVATAAA